MTLLQTCTGRNCRLLSQLRYGWTCGRFWQCPNGKDCKYRHRLPPGFKLKSEIKELLASEAANKPSLEEEIEAQRQAVEANTPITEKVRP